AGGDQQRKAGAGVLVADADVPFLIERHGISPCTVCPSGSSAQFSHLLNPVAPTFCYPDERCRGLRATRAVNTLLARRGPGPLQPYGDPCRRLNPPRCRP